MFLLLLEVRESDIGHVIARIIDEWKKTEYGPVTEIASEVRRARLNGAEAADTIRNRTDWVVVVDDDVTNLKMAGLILDRKSVV